MEAGVFYAELLFDDGERQVKIDSRTSDAIAIALRARCPIYTTENIMEEAGVIIENKQQDSEPNEDISESDEFEDLSLEDLQEKLEDAINDENYEYASRLRDEIKTRSNR